MSHEKEATKRNEVPAEHVDNRITVTPAVDVFENDDELLLTVDMPGVREGELNIRFDNNQLHLEGKAPSLSDDRVEYIYHTRAFTIPDLVDAEKIGAELKQGVLTVHMPKRAVLKYRQIEVTSA